MEYLKNRRVQRLFLLIDSRHTIKSADRKFLQNLQSMNIPFSLIMTKCDLITDPRELAIRAQFTIDELGMYTFNERNIVFTSVLNKLSIQHLRNQIESLLKKNPFPPLKRQKEMMNART